MRVPQRAQLSLLRGKTAGFGGAGMRAHPKLLAAAFCFFMASSSFACSGAIDTQGPRRGAAAGIAAPFGGASGGGGTPGSGTTPTFEEALADPLAAGPVSVRLLTRSEYEN